MANGKSRGDRETGSRAPNRARKRPPLYAAVDLGTNNCRLLIAARKRNGFTVLDSHSQIVRLGEGLEASERLSDAAIERCMDALRKISTKLKAKKVAHVRCVATEACRRAENGRDFIRRVRDELGLTFKIISGAEEAKLALVGCHNLIDTEAQKVLVIDIGGGSTELSIVSTDPVRDNGLKGLLQNNPIESWTSLPIGVVTLTELFAHLPEDQAYPEMLKLARSKMQSWKRGAQISALFEAGDAHIVGTSGTVTCLTGVHLGLSKYRRDLVDGQWISQADMMHTISRLKAAGHEGRVKFPTIGQDRAGMILAGCAIVEAAWDLAPGGRMRVGDRGLREGLLLSMMQGPPRRKNGRRRRRNRGQGARVQAEASS
ncbi:MAG: Ppx/GppA phosphatase family protein [Pseudomonadota bacterium]